MQTRCQTAVSVGVQFAMFSGFGPSFASIQSRSAPQQPPVAIEVGQARTVDKPGEVLSMISAKCGRLRRSSTRWFSF